MTKKAIFRKVALARLSSPDQLDLLMVVTHPREWIALCTFLGILAVAITWGVVGRIPSKIDGQGILIKTGGVVDILANSTGRLTILYVEEGEAVDKGQIIARIDQADLVDELSVSRKLLEELAGRRDHRSSLNQVSKSKGEKYRGEQDASLRLAVQRGQEQIRNLKARINEQEELLDEGLVTKQALLESWRKLLDVQKEIEDSVIQINKLDLQQVNEVLVSEAEDFTLNQEINRLKRQIATLELKLDSNSKVISPSQGKVIEIRSAIGNLVKPGDPLLSMEKTDRAQDLELVLYVSPQEGKRVEVGKLVQISPSTVKREEFGYMLGMVTSVSTYPSSRNAMMQILNNEQLVDMFSEREVPVAIRANLIPAPKNNRNRSGYKWSSANGPPVELSTGTLCSVEITIKSNRPISFVIPGYDKLIQQTRELSWPSRDDLKTLARNSMDKLMGLFR